ncbi:unnamed protein product [Absidia cylindrospora]
MSTHIGTIQRRIETLLVEFKQSRNIWQELNTEGLPAASKLVNSVIQSRYSDDLAYWHPSLQQEYPNIIKKYEHKMNKLIEQDYNKVSVILERMAKQYAKMATFAQEFIAIEKRASQVLENAELPIFKTCPIHIFVKRTSDIVAMYGKELALKRRLVEHGFKQISSQENGMSLLSVWLNQPTLYDHVIQEFDDICKVELDS